MFLLFTAERVMLSLGDLSEIEIEASLKIEETIWYINLI